MKSKIIAHMMSQTEPKPKSELVKIRSECCQYFLWKNGYDFTCSGCGNHYYSIDGKSFTKTEPE